MATASGSPSVTPLIDELARIIQIRIASDRLVLPAMPKVATRCLTLLKDPGVATKKLVAVLETDPVFAAQVIRAASTVAFGGQPARSLETAVSRLGLNQLRTVMTQASARALFETPNRSISARLAQVWKHSIGVAVLARDIAALMQLADVEIVYVTGLLHDVGKAVVASLLLESESALGKKVWITADQWSEVIDATHRPIGVALAERWNLDPEVVAAVRDCQEYDPGDRQCVANVIRFANALVKTQGVTAGAVDLEDAGALVMIGRSMLNLDEDVVRRLSQGLKERVDGTLTMAS